MAVADISADDVPDVLAAADDDTRIILWQNQGDGEFTQSVLGELPPGPKVLDTGDVNQDGNVDLIVATPELIAWYECEDDGGFQAVTERTLDDVPTKPLPKTVIVYDPQYQRIAHRMTAYANSTTQAALSPDGRQLAVSTPNNLIKVWELPGERLIHTLPTRSAWVRDVLFTPDGRYLLGAVGDYLQIWDTQSYSLVHDVKRHDNSIHRIAVSPDGQRIATVSDDLTVRISAALPGGYQRVLLGHKTTPCAATFSPDGRRLVTGAADGSVHIWDLKTGQELLTLTQASGVANEVSDAVVDLAFNDERTLSALIRHDKRRTSFLAQWRADPPRKVDER